MSAIGPAGSPGQGGVRELNCHVLIIEDHQHVADNFERWAVDEGLKKNVHVSVVKCVEPGYEEMARWFARRYPKGRGRVTEEGHFDIVILDIMFQRTKDGEKQLLGGLQLWEHLKGEGIDKQFDQLLVATNGEKPRELTWDAGRVVPLGTKDEGRFREVFRKMLDELR